MAYLYHNTVKIPVQNVTLEGDLVIPEHTKSLIIFAHGSGSSRFSPRNSLVAQHLQKNGMATFLFDLLTKEEEDVYTLRYDIDLLADRLIEVTHWLKKLQNLKGIPVGFFGASTGAGAALKAAALMGKKIQAVVSRGGRPDLAMNHLYNVHAATLLIVGELDEEVRALNQEAFEKLTCEKKTEIVFGATHLFEEPGALEQVAELAEHWFTLHLPPKSKSPGRAQKLTIS